MIKRHKTAIIVSAFMLVIVIISSLNLVLLLENINSRDDRVKNGVEQVLNSMEAERREVIKQELQNIHIPVKGVDYFDGKNGKDGRNGADGRDGINGTDGNSIKGETGEKGVDGKDGLTIEIRCNAKKNRWEVRYVGDQLWQVMNGEVIKCTIDSNVEE